MENLVDVKTLETMKNHEKPGGCENLGNHEKPLKTMKNLVDVKAVAARR